MAFGQAPSPFGAAPSGGFSFGAPAAANPSPFGASSAPAFGASSAPAFGAASPAPSLFGASSAPAFGAPAAASSAPSLFGTPGSSAPAFGASPTPSLFGAAPAAGAAASSGGAFSFSMPAASSAGAAGGSAFGSLFSTPAASAPAAGASIFGQPPAAQPAAPAAGIFGALTTTQPAPGAAAQPGTQLSPLAYSSSSQEAVRRELEAVAASYMPSHTAFKFMHLFLNVVDDPAQRVKPPQVLDELSWKQALRDAGGPDNPDRLWPVPALGFDDLLKRGQAQAQALAENRQRLDQLRDVAHKLVQRQSTEVAARVAAARAQHVALSNRLLAVARHVDGLEGRLANYMGMRGELSRGKEAALSRALELVEAQLSPTSPAGLQRRLDALSAACRLRASSGGLGGGGDPGSARLDEASLQQLFGVLKEHVEGLKQLQDVLRRDVLDVEIMRGARQDSSVVPAAMNIAAVEYI